MELHTPINLLVFFAVTANAFMTWIEPRHPLHGERSPPGSPWPYPQKWQRSDFVFHLDPSSFSFEYGLKGCDILEEAVKRYRPLFFPPYHKPEGFTQKEHSYPLLDGVDISVAGGCEKYPNQNSQEMYTLNVDKNKKRASLNADTVWGALRGLETLSQLVYQNADYLYLVNATDITDYPRFTYRGVLFDTARHYVPLYVLKRNLDAMAWNKFNVFHWHLVDDQSFPFESKTYPNLTKLGVYSPKHIYTHEMIKEVIEYARFRGIRVIPEIDSPGHTHAFGKAFPHLITPCYGDGKTPFTPNYTEFSAAEILNPMLDETFHVMKSLIQELKGLFPDDYVHLGMDEVYYGCWNSSPEIRKFMKEKGFDSVSQVEQYYVKRYIQDVADIGYKYMAWQDPIENGVQFKPDTVVHVWKDRSLDHKMDDWQTYIKMATSQNYDVVLSAPWYLNYISYGPDWRKYYELEPTNFAGTEAEKKHVIGGQASIWGEYVDGTNILQRFWPRASAVGERLWSSHLVNNTDNAQFRLDEQRCRMLRRGIPAAPILNGYCGDYEWEIDQTL